MFYMPILRSKAAEMEALSESDLGELYPLIDLIGARPAEAARPGREGLSSGQGRPAQLVSDHLTSVYKRVSRALGNTPVLIDPHLFLHQHPRDLDTLVEFWERWRIDEAPLQVVPVFRIGYRMSVVQALADFARKAGGWAGLRVTPSDLAVGGLATEAHSLLKLTGLQAENVHLVVDARCLVNADREALMRRCVSALQDLQPLNFATVTLAASGYLENPQRENGRVDRLERPFWAAVRERVGVELNFGDYGVDAPAETVEPDFVQVGRPMPVAAVRYTLQEQWLFLKEAAAKVITKEGKTVTQRGDFKNVCQRLLASGEFNGASFSPGDRYFEDMASGQFANSGVPSRWRQAMYSHHFAVVLNQLGEDGPEAIDAEPELPF